MVKFPTIKSVLNFKLVSLPGPHSPFGESRVTERVNPLTLSSLIYFSAQLGVKVECLGVAIIYDWHLLIQNATGTSRIHLYQKYWAIAGTIHRKFLPIFFVPIIVIYETVLPSIAMIYIEITLARTGHFSRYC